ncbi:HTH_48 domain-containing protein [Trichonephila clavipes]|nr:HTH_48 domain-containing protein [Trichonephila clavipes]
MRTNPSLTSTEVGFKLGIRQTTTLDYIRRLGFVSKFSVYVPHELSEENLMDRNSIYSSNRARHKREPFLDHLMTGDEKRIVYKHVVRKKAYVYKRETSPSSSIAGVPQKKVMLGCR